LAAWEAANAVAPGASAPTATAKASERRGGVLDCMGMKEGVAAVVRAALMEWAWKIEINGASSAWL
jgi:hypothetical protein